jgi:hypothetical protein
MFAPDTISTWHCRCATYFTVTVSNSAPLTT